jgi:hypothetical protein
MQINQYTSKNNHFSLVQFKQQTREQWGGRDIMGGKRAQGETSLEWEDAVVGGQDAIGERCLFGSGNCSSNGGMERPSREDNGGDNIEMKDFRARNRSHFFKRVHAHEGHGYHK